MGRGWTDIRTYTRTSRLPDCIGLGADSVKMYIYVQNHALNSHILVTMTFIYVVEDSFNDGEDIHIYKMPTISAPY